MRKTIRICSKEWDLQTDPKGTGGIFETYKNTGKGCITIGSKWKEKQFRYSILIHEVLEAILTTDGKRFGRRLYRGDDAYMFVFDHDYLEILPDKILDALVSCGVIKLKKK